MRAVFSFIIVLLSTASANASGWGLFGQQNKLKGLVIVEVGELSEIHHPQGKLLPTKLFQMNGRFFSAFGYFGFGNQAALLLVNEAQVPHLATFEPGIGSVKTTVSTITLYECPEWADILPYSDDPEEMLRLLQERQEKLKRQLEELQKK